MKSEIQPSFMTGNQSIVTTLGSLGFGFPEEQSQCVNTYGKNEPILKDKDGSPIKPGNVKFNLNRYSDTFLVSIEDVLEEWRSGNSDKVLDDLIQPGADDTPEVAKLKREVMDVLPLALTSYFKGCLRNRKEVAGKFKTVTPMRGWQENGTSFLISDNATDKMKEDLGC